MVHQLRELKQALDQARSRTMELIHELDRVELIEQPTARLAQLYHLQKQLGLMMRQWECCHVQYFNGAQQALKEATAGGPKATRDFAQTFRDLHFR